ncbi:MAG: anthranilate phosphoribosyltransferase [Actinomycetota bacterium]|nr:anthranilate phosphoribosyltransferase [Actinomycetota bacterium]
MSRPTPPEATWPDLLTRLLDGGDLTGEHTGWVMDKIMTGEATPAQVAAFAVALRAKGETAAEVEGLVTSMLAHSLRVTAPGRCVDIVGTGGDRANTVNISTMSALVVAAAGAPVIKHGNRAASSKCGAADLLEALGISIRLGKQGVETTLAELGIGFCFAPVFHPALRFVGPPRREIGIPTVFNFLGPLTNPAQPAAGAIGCGSTAMAPVMAEVFARRGADVLVFRGDDGLDELTTTTTSAVWVVTGGSVLRTSIDPRRFGVPVSSAEDLVGGEVPTNVAAARELFDGRPGAVRDAVLLNSAAALAVHAGLSGDAGSTGGSVGRHPQQGLEDSIAAGLQRAASAVDSGAAAALVDAWAQRSTELTPAEA